MQLSTVAPAGLDADAVPAPAWAYAGLIAAPSRSAYPDTAVYAEVEIYFRPRLREFVSLIVRSPLAARVDELLDVYAQRFRQDFMP